MKIAIVLVGLSMAVMVAMIVQAVRQEMTLHNLKTRMSVNAAEVKRKEDDIVDVKSKVTDLKTALKSLNAKMDELKIQKGDLEKTNKNQETGLKSCNTVKADVVKKKTETTESINKLKADHGVAKTKAEEDIKSLKQQILDRDKAICAFADATKEEARRLCGIPVSSSN